MGSQIAGQHADADGKPAPRLQDVTNPRFIVAVDSIAYTEPNRTKRWGYHLVVPYDTNTAGVAYTAHGNACNTLWLDGSVSAVSAVRSSLEDYNAGYNMSQQLYDGPGGLTSEWHRGNYCTHSGRIP